MKNRLNILILTIIIFTISSLSYGQDKSEELQKNIIDLNDEQFAQHLMIFSQNMKAK